MPRPKRTRITPFGVSEIHKAGQAARPRRATSIAPSEDDVALSTDSDGLVTSNTLGRNRRGISAIEARMSGALAHRDAEGGAKSQSVNRDNRTEPKGVLELEGDAQAVKRRNKSKTEQVPRITRREAGGNVRQRRIVGSLAGCSNLRTRSLSHEMNGDFHARPENSVFGSIFKARQRKPSLLHALECQRALTQEQGEDFEDNSFGMYTFGTAEESPPFHQNASSGASITQDAVPITSSGYRKRKRGSAQVPQLQISGKQQPLDSSPPATLGGQGDPQSLAHGSFDIFANAPSPRYTPPLTCGILPRQKNAHKSPPFSSSQSPLSVPSSAQLSPVKFKRKLPAPKPLTTARLQNLLPRRKSRSSFAASALLDLQSSDIEYSVVPSSDADELNVSPAKRSWQKASAHRSKPPNEKTVRQHRTSRTYSRARQPSPGYPGSDLDANTNTLLSPAKPAKPPKLQSPARKKLQATAKWFKEEVDQWQLEVEDVSMHSQSSAMRDAR